MNVPLWMLIPGAALAFIGAIVVTFIGWMAADEIRLARRRQTRPTSDRPTLTVLTDTDEDESLGGLVVEYRARRRNP